MHENNIKINLCLTLVSSRGGGGGGSKQMCTTTSVYYLYRLHYSRSMKKYKLSSKNEENERTVSVTKKEHCTCLHHSLINIPTHEALVFAEKEVQN
jgi:hypothetical protein